MEDSKLVIYDIPLFSYLELVIKDDCFIFNSEVRMSDGDVSEASYSLSLEEVTKLQSIIQFDDFIELVRKEKVKGMLNFFKKNNIKCSGA